MEKKKIVLEKGYVLVYDFGKIKVHNYSTQDFMDDQVLLLEKDHQMVVIKSTAFYENHTELETYIHSLGVTIDGILLSYHMGGGNFLKDVKKYATEQADEYGHHGGGKALIDNFTKTFGEIFDHKLHKITDYIEEGKITLANIEMKILPTNDGYDIEIPEINSIYTHMLGSDCHSILAGSKHATAMIDVLKGYIEKNYQWIFTSHYIPERIDALQTKITYIETVLNIASTCTNAEEMIEKVKKEFPKYHGENYLEMTAYAFFPRKK